MGETKTVVLLVDDQVIVAEAIRRMLAEHPDIEMRHCADVMKALPMAHEVRPTVILQDLVMPDVDGFTLVRFFKADPRTSNIPIIVLSSKEDPKDKSRAFEIGASDYLVKIPNKVELVARVRAHSRSFLAQRERDEAYRVLEQLKAELELKNRELQLLSGSDGLTGLANRRHFDERFAVEWQRCRREGVSLALVMVDVDFFKKYNDAYGHVAGDDCLRAVGAALKVAARRPADLVARYGGEEFSVLLPNTTSEGACIVAEHLRETVASLGIPHAGSDVVPHVTLSLGVASAVPSEALSPTALIEHADRALYEAKRGGRNGWRAASSSPGGEQAGAPIPSDRGP